MSLGGGAGTPSPPSSPTNSENHNAFNDSGDGRGTPVPSPLQKTIELIIRSIILGVARGLPSPPTFSNNNGNQNVFYDSGGGEGPRILSPPKQTVWEGVTLLHSSTKKSTLFHTPALGNPQVSLIWGMGGASARTWTQARHKRYKTTAVGIVWFRGSCLLTKY